MTLPPTAAAPEERQLTLPVRGMTCASCAARIEQGFARTPGVAAAQVNFAAGSAQVRYRPGEVGDVALIERLESLGFETEVVREPVALRADAPAEAVERALEALRRVSGVRSVVLEAPGRAVAEIPACLLDPRTLRAAVARAAPEAAVADATAGEGPVRDPGAGEEVRARTEQRVAGARALVAGVLAAIVMALTMAPGLAAWGPAPWIAAALATFAQFWCGWPFYRGFVASTRHAAADMNTLIAVGTTAAWGASVVTLFRPDWLVPPGGHAHLYFETSVMILAFILFGRWLELRARGKTRDALRALIDMRPRIARRLGHAGEETVPAATLRPGDRIVLVAGERVPADGTIESGRAALDESMLTGESLPIDRAEGDPVHEGTLDVDGRLVVRVGRVGRETVLAQVIALVERAQGSRAPVQRLADRVAAVFVPAVIVVAAATLAGWLLFGGENARVLGLSGFVAVLIVACPCALGLATPTAIMVAAGRGAREGILVRDAGDLEAADRVDTVVFDKTGTLTRGRPEVRGIVPAPGVAERELLQAALDAEQGSDHPIARAVAARARAEGLSPGPVESVESRAGHGIVARTARGEIRLGRLGAFEGANVSGLPTRDDLDALAAEGAAPVLVARDGRWLGALMIADPPREESAEAVAGLKAAGMRVVLLSGDHRRVVDAFGRALGIEEIFAEVLPAEKEAKVRELQASGRRVAMVGDGINDAPALARADVGIAMAGGTDVAIASAGITLMRGDPRGVTAALGLGRATLRTIRVNLFFAFFYNVAMIPLAAGLLHGWGWSLNPMWAALAMALSSVTVVQNSLRLRGARLTL